MAETEPAAPPAEPVLDVSEPEPAAGTINPAVITTQDSVFAAEAEPVEAAGSAAAEKPAEEPPPVAMGACPRVARAAPRAGVPVHPLHTPEQRLPSRRVDSTEVLRLGCGALSHCMSCGDDLCCGRGAWPASATRPAPAPGETPSLACGYHLSHGCAHARAVRT